MYLHREKPTAIFLAKLLLAMAFWPLFPLGSLAGDDGRSCRVIVAFGDSLTAATQVTRDSRWPNLLEKALRQRCPDLEVVVVNAGVNGNTSREGLARMDRDVLARRPDLVIVEFVNDAAADPARHVSVDESARNFAEMHRQIVRQAGAKMICWPCTPILDARHALGRNAFYAAAGGLDGYENSYRKRLAEVCHGLQVPFLDMDAIFRSRFKGDGEDAYLLSDGIHYREAGNRLVAESLLPEVEKMIRDRRR